MTTAATIDVILTADGISFQKELDKSTKAAEAFDTKMKNVGKGMMKAGGVMTAGMTLPLVAVGKTMVDAASDLGESQNAVNVVFRESADVLKKYSETSAETVGLAASDFNQLAAVTGAFLTNMGFSADQAAGETIDLTERAADMASIFNTDVSSALEAIQSGLKGEFNPLEQFGVKLNAATIEAKALEMGLADQNGQLSDNAKAQAALSLIYEQTNKYAGDFRNTSDGLANSSRILQAELKDASAQLGTQLLPFVLKAVQFFQGLIDKFTNLSPAAQKAIVVIGGILAVIGPVVTAVGGMITAIGTIMPVITAIGAAIGPVLAVVGGAIATAAGPILLVIAAIAAAVALLYLAWKTNFLGIRDTVTTIFNAIKLVFQAFQAAFHGDWKKFGELLRQAWDLVWNLMQKRIEAGWTFIKGVAQKIVDGIKAIFQIDWSQLGQNIIQGIVNGIKRGIQWVTDAARQVAQAAMQAVQGFLGISSPSKVMFNFGEMTAKGFALGMMAKNDLSIPKALMASQSGAVASAPGAPAGAVAGGQNITINIENPKKETAEESIRRTLKSLSFTGVIAS
jgi:phage-related minor tail protein